MKLKIQKTEPPEYMHDIYINIRDVDGHSATYATEMGVCDYQGIFKGVSSRNGTHMTQCLSYVEGKEELILRIVDLLDEGVKFNATFEIMGVEHKIDAEQDFKDFMVLIDKAFDNTLYKEEIDT